MIAEKIGDSQKTISIIQTAPELLLGQLGSLTIVHHHTHILVFFFCERDLQWLTFIFLDAQERDIIQKTHYVGFPTVTE